MGNSNVKNSSSHYSRRPHSVLGVRSDERYPLGDQDHLSRYNENVKGIRVPGKAILPPLPRSHSFHQILRPTENGVNLIQKGTIRGIDNKSHHHHHGKDILLSPEDILNPELNAILRERRCKSEADLIAEEDEKEEEEREDNLEEKNSSSDKSTERSEGLRKGLTNGVAARIQRAKYKAPQPPPTIQANRNNNNHVNNNEANKFNGRPSEPEPNKVIFDGLLRNSRRSLQVKEKVDLATPESKPKLSLIRRLSEKSHLSSRTSDLDLDEHSSPSLKDNFMMLPRLKVNGFLGEPIRKDNSINENKINRLISERNYLYPGNEPAMNEINDFIARELALRSHNGIIDGSLDHDGELMIRESGGNPRGMSKMFRKDNCSRTNSSNNGKSSPESKGFKGQTYLPPVFDDNFILKRTTPTAGLIQNFRPGNLSPSSKKFNDLYPNKLNHEPEKNKYNKEMRMLSSPVAKIDPKRCDDTRQLINSPLPAIRQWTPNYRQSPATPPTPPPPPPPTLQFLAGGRLGEANLSSGKYLETKEESNFCRISSPPLKPLNHSSISDSANYSDEDDEEEIKVVLKPYLPPPRRIPFNEERIIINDDLFNTDDASAIKCATTRQQCWTPMEDLTSSDDDDDDDGIHCGDNQSEDEDAIGKRDVRDLIHDYNTRFTLKNQLRTLIQNNKLRSQPYP